MSHDAAPRLHIPLAVSGAIRETGQPAHIAKKSMRNEKAMTLHEFIFRAASIFISE